jgi:hypothetical protein
MSAPKGNKNAKGNGGGPGRPPVYSARIPWIVCGLRERGATEREIAAVLGISDRTLRRWAAEHIEFSSALSVSNRAMVNRARQALFERAAGYSFETEKIFQYQGSIIRAKTLEHVPPDPTAALRILERLEPETWKERTEVEGKGSFSLADLVALSMADREAKARAATDPKLIEGDSKKIEK